jgi:dihydropteroate synthase
MKYNAHLGPARDEAEARTRLAGIGADPDGTLQMAPKMRHYCVKLAAVGAETARAVKRELLGLGGEAAVSAEVYARRGERTDMMLMATLGQYRTLADQLAPGGGEGAAVAVELSELLAKVEVRRFTVPTPRGALALGERPVLMGIVNCTPDSFFDGGKFFAPERAVARGKELAAAGAAILDVGGESTRPGAEAVGADEEIARVVPVIARLAAETGALVSVDTQKARVARAAIHAGAAIINDVSALGDPAMAALAAETGAGLVLMHMRGTPPTMQQAPHYEDLFGEIIAYLRERMARAEAAGVTRERIIVDPGIGFGKTVAHNLELIRDLGRLRSLGRPILLGPSNKSFIGQVLSAGPEDRGEGTAAAAVAGTINGAHILRLHDVAGMRRYVEMAGAIVNLNQ